MMRRIIDDLVDLRVLHRDARAIGGRDVGLPSETLIAISEARKIARRLLELAFRTSSVERAGNANP